MGQVQSGKRIEFLDMARGIGILLVVIGHSGYLQGTAFDIINSFHMPLFFVISGFLYHPSRDFIKNRLKKIMLPYGVFSLVYLAIQFGYRDLWKHAVTHAYVISSVIRTVSFNGISVLWFLSCLFVSEAAYDRICNKCGRVNIWLIPFCSMAIGCVLAKLISQNETLAYRVTDERGFALQFVCGVLYLVVRSLIALGFLAFGYLLKLAGDRLGRWIREEGRRRLACFGGALLCFALCALGAHYNGTVDLHFLVLGNIFLFCLDALTGAVGVVLLCRALPRLSGLCYLGKNSLTIMLTHLDCMFLLIAIRTGERLTALCLGKSVGDTINEGLQLPVAGQLLFYAFLAVSLLLLEIFAIVVCNRFFPWAVGRRKESP